MYRINDVIFFFGNKSRPQTPDFQPLRHAGYISAPTTASSARIRHSGHLKAYPFRNLKASMNFLTPHRTHWHMHCRFVAESVR